MVPHSNICFVRSGLLRRLTSAGSPCRSAVLTSRPMSLVMKQASVKVPHVMSRSHSSSGLSRYIVWTRVRLLSSEKLKGLNERCVPVSKLKRFFKIIFTSPCQSISTLGNMLFTRITIIRNTNITSLASVEHIEQIFCTKQWSDPDRSY